MVGAPGLRACGPWLPEQILTRGQVILRTPAGDFAQEVVALTPDDGAPVLPEGLVRVAPQGREDYNVYNEEQRQNPSCRRFFPTACPVNGRTTWKERRLFGTMT